MTRIAIAAPNPLLRAGLRAVLSTNELQVVAEAASLSDLAPQLDSLDLLLIADDNLSEEAITPLLGDNAPAILVLSESDRAASLLRILPLRGWGIVPPDTPAAELLAAVMAVAQGLIVLHPPLATRLLDQRSNVQALDDGTLREQLTIRETEVLALLSQGLPNKLIARQLSISEHTVKFHVSSIYTKLGASSRTEAVSKGARHGLITL